MSDIKVGEVKTDTIKDQSGTGIVTFPNRPAFFVYNSSNDWTNNVTAGTLIIFNTAKFNVGSHFDLSTYKFTAPVTGLYQFNIRIYVNNDAGTNAWGVAINNTVYNHSNANYPLFGDLVQGVGTYDFGSTGSHCLQLNASDTVHVQSMHNNLDYFGTMTSFSGYLIG